MKETNCQVSYQMEFQSIRGPCDLKKNSLEKYINLFEFELCLPLLEQKKKENGNKNLASTKWFIVCVHVEDRDAGRPEEQWKLTKMSKPGAICREKMEGTSIAKVC